jgi:hypothetical protein
LSIISNVNIQIYTIVIRRSFSVSVVMALLIQGAAFNVTNFESRITHLLYTAINTAEHG